MNDGIIHPIGYCSGWNSPKPGDWLYDLHRDYWDNAKTFEAKYHTDGHATEVEASDCYREYILDQQTHFVQVHPFDACVVCGKLTDGAAQVEGWIRWILCLEHQNRETIEKLWPAGEIITSIHS